MSVPGRSSASMVVGMVGLMAAVVVAYAVTAPMPASASAEDVVPDPIVEPAVEPFPAPAAAVVPPAAPAAPAPSPGAAPPTPAALPVVAVVGDSLAYSVAMDLDRGLRALGTAPVLDVAPGRRIPVRGLDGRISTGLDTARALRSARPAVWVVQLGTNDIAYEPLDQSRYAFWVIAMLEAVGPDVPVVWVNVHRADRPDESAAFDAVLSMLAAERPQLHVADWAAVAATEPVLAPDGVHLGANGDRRYAEVIVAAVAAAVQL